ncbi:MAG: GEVED domain-containing protein, partial [Thermoanaerobaculia bacterium]
LIATASPTSVDEPGGLVSFTVHVDNTGNTDVDLTALSDDLLGNLDGQGSCAVPQTIVDGGFYECSFSAAVTGNAGTSVTDTVTASGAGSAGAVSDSASATVTITGTDYGDAPDPSYPTLQASDGARHTLGSGLFLGSGIDADADGQPNADASGDDADGNDDEDGVSHINPLGPGQSASVEIVASAVGVLDAWVDFDGDGTWSAAERIFTAQVLTAGTNTLSFTVPADAVLGTTFARYRLSSTGMADPTGLAPDGEVEDYEITTGCGTNADCDNGLFCDGAESCDVGTGACQAGTTVDCDDGVSCTVDACNEGTDACDNTSDDGLCDNGLFCDGTETCDAALGCQMGTAVDCDDGVSCTNDACDESTDSCTNVLIDDDGDGVCNDFDVCPGFDDNLDADGDGVPDGCDACQGDDSTGDDDQDGVCNDADCDDEDPDSQYLDNCGVCGGDDSTCSIFSNGFESGDTSAW